MGPGRILCGVLGALTTVGLAAGPGLLRWETTSGFRPDPDLADAWLSPVVEPGGAWDQVVPSWNASPEVRVAVAIRAVRDSGATPWFGMGRWTGGPRPSYRTSDGPQSGPDGRVETDTLVLTRPAGRFQVRLLLEAGSIGEIRRVAISGVLSSEPLVEPPPFPGAWGRELAVPIHSQAEYPEGIQTWCSPTSLTMLLGWWADALDRPGLRSGVREVAAGVFDPGWPGTGNWSFNMAHAGSRPGLGAMVARLGGVVDLERWIHAGLPVAVSVSYARLKGADTASPGDGHLVVVRGFTSDGDVIVNDPGVRRSRVRRVVPRADFIGAWGHSLRTAYLVWPESAGLPAGGDGRW